MEDFRQLGLGGEDLLAVDDAVMGVWKWGGGSGGQGVGCGGQEEKLASGGDSGTGGGERGCHIVDCTECNDLKTPFWGHHFDAGGPDLGGQAQGSDYLSKEGGFFVL